MQFFKDGIHRTAQGLREFYGEEAIYSMKEQNKSLGRQLPMISGVVFHSVNTVLHFWVFSAVQACLWSLSRRKPLRGKQQREGNIKANHPTALCLLNWQKEMENLLNWHVGQNTDQSHS